MPQNYQPANNLTLTNAACEILTQKDITYDTCPLIIGSVKIL